VVAKPSVAATGTQTVSPPVKPKPTESTSPKAPVKTLRAAGPIIVLILIVAAAFLGYYQVVYYPTIAPTTATTSSIGPLEENVTVIIPNGAQDPSTPTSLTFLPNVITVYIGYNATVIWYNNDSALHTVTAKPNSPDSKFNQWGPTSAPYNNVNPNGGTVTYTFTIPGIYNYTCSYHLWMGGEVIVKAAPPGLVNSTTTGSTSKSSS
jgi:plastocyanin